MAHASAGYYRLLAAADIFIIFDCVQFPRRGWVHRNQLHNADGQLDWLTLPLAKADYNAPISDLKFQPDAVQEMQDRSRHFPVLSSDSNKGLLANVINCTGTVVDYLEQTIRLTLEQLDITSPRIMRSSQLAAPAHMHAADRIIWLVKEVGGKTYINAPGGRAIYNQEQFNTAELELRFLTPYTGSTVSILERLMTEAATNLKIEIMQQCVLEK